MAVTKRMEDLGLAINVDKIDNEGIIAPWFKINMASLEEVDEGNLPEQLRFWGIAKAKADRVLAVRQRDHRKWRSKFQKHAVDPADKPAGWKKPSEKIVEASYRTSKVYREQNEEIEKTAEALGVISAIVAGLNARVNSD